MHSSAENNSATDELPPIIAPDPTASSTTTDLPKREHMGATPHPLVVLIVFLLAVFISAALAAPRFHASVQFLAESHLRFRGLAEQPFHRYVGRALLLFAIVGLPLFLRGLRTLSWRALGLDLRLRSWGEAVQGMVWGFVTLAIVVALAVSSGARSWDLQHSTPQVLNHLRSAALVGVIVSLMEELLFRGALFNALRRRYSFWSAALLSSGAYALLHFFEKPPEPDSIQWYTGLVTLGQMVRGFTDWHSLIPGFMNLTLLGLILCLTLERTGSLLFAIGLHAALVFCVKTTGFLTDLNPQTNPRIWGNDGLIDGWACGFILILVFCALRALLPRPRTEHA